MIETQTKNENTSSVRTCAGKSVLRRAARGSRLGFVQSRILIHLALGLVSLLMVLFAGGCVIGQLIGGMAASAKEAGSSEVSAEYDDLSGHTYAVVATTDRSIQAEFPALIPTIIQRLDLQLSQNSQASGHVPGDDVIGYLANHPQWVAWPRARLAKELGVERIVFVEINSFRTNESGNEYVWNGLIWGAISVIDADSESSTDQESFHKEFQITFPDGSGYGPDDMSKQVVAAELLRRFIQRAGWLFYDHEEKNSLEY